MDVLFVNIDGRWFNPALVSCVRPNILATGYSFIAAGGVEYEVRLTADDVLKKFSEACW